jgi:hypothetical protein
MEESQSLGLSTRHDDFGARYRPGCFDDRTRGPSRLAMTVMRLGGSSSNTSRPLASLIVIVTLRGPPNPRRAGPRSMRLNPPSSIDFAWIFLIACNFPSDFPTSVGALARVFPASVASRRNTPAAHSKPRFALGGSRRALKDAVPDHWAGHCVQRSLLGANSARAVASARQSPGPRPTIDRREHLWVCGARSRPSASDHRGSATSVGPRCAIATGPFANFSKTDFQKNRDQVTL